MLSSLIFAAGLLSPNPGLIFWTAVTFLLLVFILSKVAWKPIVEALSEREKNIQSAIDRAEQAKAEAEKTLAELKAERAKAQAEAEKIVSDAKAYAEKIRAELLEKANAEARKTLEDAKAEIELAKRRAMAELKDTVADLAIEAASKIIQHNLDAERHKDLIASVINDLSTVQKQ
ncbi:MAG: F0F1 ATP synthase subunit B [Chloroherpetonaceae bacterium]|nr:F0F1 ATP synthase subunit B [Chloroherpetonaceae bacterium]MDW8437680.1 F0F1 ATP synthase subunit B [Chloroherpetonaceae bacterium]